MDPKHLSSSFLARDMQRLMLNNTLEQSEHASSLNYASFTKLFEQQVERTPDSIAIEFEGRKVTYLELNECVNRIAHSLLQMSLPSETRIGICLDRSIEAIQSMLGILKAGLAFVPLDPEFPADRLEYIVSHAGIPLIICDDRYTSLYANLDPSTVQIVKPEHFASESDTRNPDVELPSNLLAYVMYTSGSTGKPKGVQIEHGSLVTYCLADVELYRLEASDRTLQFSTLNFDVAIEEIYPPLLVGSAVVVRPRERADASIELSHLIETNQITALHIATAYWNEWVDLMAASEAQVPDCLRLVIVTGEKISVEHYRRWRGLCQQEVLWCNAYGPTETTVTCTAFIPDPNWDGMQMPIGRPLPGYDAHILDETLRPVGEGETGQLFIGGPAVARGYLDRPDLTDKAFLNIELAGLSGSQRIYRTGDLARWLPSGDIEFSGRVDHQMKIGSYRIEPGEIESVMNLHPDIRESLVVCEEANGQKYLVAYLVPQEVSRFDQCAYMQFLRDRLPGYMVPTRGAILDSLPKTINGKIDRAALPRGTDLVVLGGIQDESLPSTDLERQLAEVWKGVLQLPSVGVHDDFFHLGGSSLLVTKIIARMSSELNMVIPVRDFFANPTIASMGRQLEYLRDAIHSNRNIASESSTANLRSKLPEICSLEIRSAGARLANVHYPPVAGKQPSRKHAVVMVPTYGHEATRAFRNMQQLAVQLAQNGFDVVRFDYAGTGDSDGGLERLSLRQWREDVRSVVDAVRSKLQVERVSIVGVRLGANVVASSRLEQIEHFVAWDPVLDGPKYLDQLSNMHAEETSGLTRYLSVRELGREEIMGYPWPFTLGTEVAATSWPLAEDFDASYKSWIVTVSEKSQQHPVQNTSCWNIYPNEDEIYWNCLMYANSAFASPATSKTIIKLLCSEE
ncbi:non-ribosomal peptide synthetase [Pirellulaceae bacterium SH449]